MYFSTLFCFEQDEEGENLENYLKYPWKNDEHMAKSDLKTVFLLIFEIDA